MFYTKRYSFLRFGERDVAQINGCCIDYLQNANTSQEKNGGKKSEDFIQKFSKPPI